MLRLKDNKGRVAVVTGGSRGIGRECCLAMARLGIHIAILAKSVTDTPELPGTIFSVAKEVEALGVEALPLQCNIRSEDNIKDAVEKIVAKWGRIDILINNASALWWQDMADTPIKKYDLIHSVNARGSFIMAKYCLPHMEKNKFGRVVCMSPPIGSKGYKGSTAYNHSKMGMTMVAMGVSEEYAGKGITAFSLWPATVIESQAAINFKLGETKFWRKATILADAVIGLINEDDDYTGEMLIDDTYLKTRQGFTDQDLVKYRYDPNFDPPRSLAGDGGHGDDNGGMMIKRGDVKKLATDIKTTNKLAEAAGHKAKL